MIQSDGVHIFLDLYSSYNQMLGWFIDRVSNSVLENINMQYVKTALRVTLILSFLAVLFGKAKPSIEEASYKFFYYGVVVFLATNSTGYGDEIADMTFDLPDQLISVIQGGDGSIENSLGLIDDSFTAYFNFYEKMIQAANASTGLLQGIGIMIVAYAVLICGLLVCVAAAGFLLVSKMNLALLLALAPLFIFALLTPMTAKYFGTWLALVISFVLWPVFGAALVELFHTVMHGTVLILNDGWADHPVYSMVPIIVFTMITLFCFKSIGLYVRDLVGGSAYEGGQAVSTVYQFASRQFSSRYRR